MMACGGSARLSRRVPAPRVLHAFGALVVGLAALIGNADAQTQRKPAPERARSELQWLRDVQAAAQNLNYSGTIIYQQGTEVRASRLTHVVEGNVASERLQPLDGQLREFIRHADEVLCLIPQSRRIVVERRLAPDAFPAIAAADPAEILEHYTVRLGGTERVAGIECQVILIEPKDRMRYGYRLSVDRATGLLLRAAMLDERNEVLEQMAFAEVRIGERVDGGQLKPSWSTEGWRVERTEQPPIELAQHGWHIAPPTGFRKLREVLRSFRVASAERKAMQAVFTDGLANLSVFIEPSAADAVIEAAQSDGPTSVYARRVADARVTVVGELPMATVKAVAKSIEFRAPR